MNGPDVKSIEHEQQNVESSGGDASALNAAVQGLELVHQLQSQKRWPSIQAGFVNINIVQNNNNVNSNGNQQAVVNSS